jgi:predicted secreted hydrolase
MTSRLIKPALSACLVSIVLALISTTVWSANEAGEADAYQLLRSDPTGYANVTQGRPFEFPADHLPHKAFRIEWWYLTANLEDDNGTSYGVHWTLFRQSLSPQPDPGGWASNQMWMAHAALSTPDGHFYEQRFARGGVGQAGVSINAEGVFEAVLDDWILRGAEAEPIPGTLSFKVDNALLQLTLSSNTPWVLQGDAGFSQKSDLGQASYYYSQPHISVVGTITESDKSSRLKGSGWLDREWSSQPLAPDQPGWDWLSVHLDDGHALMVYRLRRTQGEDWISGTWITPAGQPTPLSSDDIIFQPLSTTSVATGNKRIRNLPLEWHVALPGSKQRWTVTAQSPDHWLNTAFPYWEGPVTIEGSSKGSSNGNGFLELTGY